MQPWDDPEVKLQQRLVAQGREQPPELGLFGTLWTYAWAIVGILFAAVFIFTLTGIALESVQHLWAALQSVVLRILVGTAAVALAAGGLYWLKEKHSKTYGGFEIAFALGSTARACVTVTGKSTAEGFFVMAGCVYLIVRGLGNFLKVPEKKCP